jgi:hypothetical protein
MISNITFSHKIFGNNSNCNEGNFGLRWYAAEHWAGSHPEVVPCNVANLIDLPEKLWRENTSKEDICSYQILCLWPLTIQWIVVGVMFLCHHQKVS